ncbi:MAG: hypothetical protein SOW77_07070 [Ruminococcus sp.]|nr:hypothetical protein [Ruminococcus sp.]
MNKPLSKDEILSIAKQNGIKISYLNKLIGGYRGKLTDWKNGKTTLTESELEILTNYILEKNYCCFSEKEQILIEKYRLMNAEQQEKLLKEIDLL